jgi:protein ImuA
MSLAALTSLRQRIAALEGRSVALEAAAAAGPAWALGVPEIDAHLGGGLELGAVHSVEGDAQAALGFALRLLLRVPSAQPLVWVEADGYSRSQGRVYGPGLQDLGVDPARFLFVRPAKPADGLWAIEEAVRSGAVAGVLGVGLAADFTAVRRVSLAAAHTGVPCLVVDGEAEATATRWRVGPRASAGDADDPAAPGTLAWTLMLERARGRPPALWDVEVAHDTGGFRLAAPAEPGAAGSASAPYRAERYARTG